MYESINNMTKAYHFTQCIHHLGPSHAGNGTPNPFMSYYQGNLILLTVGPSSPESPLSPGLPEGPAGPLSPCLPGDPLSPRRPRGPSFPGGPSGPASPMGPWTQTWKQITFRFGFIKEGFILVQVQHTGIVGKTSTNLPMTINRLK